MKSTNPACRRLPLWGVGIAVQCRKSRPFKSNDKGRKDMAEEIITSTNAETATVSYTHLRAHETDSYLVCRLLLEKKKKKHTGKKKEKKKKKKTKHIQR